MALKKAVLAFFQHDLSWQRGDDGVRRFVLEDRKQLAVAARVPSRAQRTAEKEQRELDQARQELAALLDVDAGLRSAMRHLAFVEHALEKKGWRALHKLPLDVLQQALRQFEGLVTNWSPVGLACLRSKMAVAVIDREHQDGDDEADAYKTAAVLESPPAIAAQAIENARASASAAVAKPMASTAPAIPTAAVEENVDDETALLAAYAALGVAPGAETAVELQGELGSPSAKAITRDAARRG